MNANYIEFYFDCSSPWTYLAFVEIESLSQRHKLEIEWKPVLVGGVFNTVNQDVYEFRKKPNPLKLNYSNEDLHLWSKVRGISISFPEVFPVNSVKAMRGCLFAEQESKLVEFANNVFHAYWSEGKDISQEDLLIKNTKELVHRGGFGSPTFFYNNHMFFGNDRLSLFEQSYRQGLLDQ